MFLTLDGERKVRAGLEAPGAHDLIGWVTKEITPDMVGQRIAVFTSLEVKTARGRVSKDQANFARVVQAAGGIAGVAMSADDAVELLGQNGISSSAGA